MQYYIGIDLGTSSVKSLLMEENGRAVETAQEGYEIIKREQQYAEQDIDLLCDAALRTVRTLLEKHPDAGECIKGVGFSGQMHGLVVIGRIYTPSYQRRNITKSR